MQNFISEFQSQLFESVEQHSFLIKQISQQQELAHLISKLPNWNILDLGFKIEELREQFVEYHAIKYKNVNIDLSNFKLNELLNIHN